jgi:general secretion pathway protein E
VVSDRSAGVLPGNAASATELLGREYLEEQRLLPLGREDGSVVVAFSGRPDPQAVAEIEALYGASVVLREVPEAELFASLRQSPGTGLELAELSPGEAPSGPAQPGEEELLAHDLQELANQAPVIRLVNALLAEAVAAQASDVHLETHGRGLRVRYRVDGLLEEVSSPPAHLKAAIVSRLKIMAELDIAERRLPQDGRVRLRIDGRELDVRVSTLPTLHGESVVLRLLGTAGPRLELETLGMCEETLAALVGFGSRPQGMLLSTGPTGSGKTTTLYALLERIRTGREKIVSVEDPVEYELPGVAQVPVRPEAGLSFARALRSILRQDPDVLLVGEMRDTETAEICTQAALTGHLVLSTLHTNDAPSGLTRLLDLKVPDFLIASTVELILAQRLVRRVCAGCAEAEPADEATRRAATADGWEVRRLRRGRGCTACGGSGYRGRAGIYELLRVDGEIREAFLRRPGTAAIRELALERGMRPLRADGWRLVTEGLTTPEEVLRVTTV